jgi:hypothetical protein
MRQQVPDKDIFMAKLGQVIRDGIVKADPTAFKQKHDGGRRANHFGDGSQII